MNTDPQHPAPQAQKVGLHESFFGVFAGPIAWLVQLGLGYSMATQPCFIGGARGLAPAPGSQWTLAGMGVLMAGATVIALLSLLVSWSAYRKTATEARGDGPHLLESGGGRTRFLAIWGMLLGGGFALATVLTAVGFVLLPRCAG
jgi:hypothetical protein